MTDISRLDPLVTDTLPVKGCGCVPHLSILYEDKQPHDSLDDSGVVEDIGPPSRGGWTKKIPLLGPFWCVRNTHSTTVRRRDNAVYRSNSFKFERRGPAAPEVGSPASGETSTCQTSQITSKLEQVIQSKKQNKKPLRSVLVHEDPVNDAVFSHQSKKPPELLVNLNYSDPQDAESDLALWHGNVNQAYEAEDIVGSRDSGLHRPVQHLQPPHRQQQVPHGQVLGQGPGPSNSYKVKFGHDIYYCKPYQPFHTQLRYNFSDLLESGVDSEYEEMASAAKWTNNNTAAGGGGPGPCSQCVTVINVCPSPGHTLLQQPGGGGHKPLGGKLLPVKPLQNNQQPATGLPPGGQSSNYAEPPYENLSFHKVTINVPDVGEDVHHLYTEKPRVLLRKPPLKKSKVPLKYQGIKRVKSKSKTQKHEHNGNGVFDKSGYSQKEVWNWLYLEEAAKNNGFNIETYEMEDGSGGVDGDMAREKSVSVQFSPVEFLQATNRLAHLNLEGFERFVGSTIDRALAGARAKSSDVLDARDKDKENPSLDHQQVIDKSLGNKNNPESHLYTTSDRDTDMYVGKDPNIPLCPHKTSRPVCESCIRSGESSCSSALSSLESVKSSLSQGPRSRTECDSSARGSYMSSESSSGTGSTPEYMRVATPAPAPDYMRMSGQKMYRGKIRASLPVGGPSHKPYQTLEVSPDHDKAGVMSVTLTSGGGPGHHVQAQHQQPLHLVDPSIQLHQQEWYHGNISRVEAEAALRLHPSGSYLVRNCESARKDYSLSLKSSHGFMHMRIQLTPTGQYILGQFSRPFNSIADMINYYTINRLPIKGAEHVSLKMPLCEQLL